jgi:pyruvate-formate lyase-activating enzyme
MLGIVLSSILISITMSNEQKIHILKDKRQQINAVSNSFCTAKWLQTTLYLQNGYNHSCHHPAPHKIPVDEVIADASALHNSAFKKEQRAKMLVGERPGECEYCWKTEDNSPEHFSDRHYKTSDTWAWDRFEEIAKSDPSANVNPAYLEVSFSNACNFKCVYCSPEISSRWLEEIQQHGQYPTSQSNYNLDYLKTVGKYPYKNSDDNPYVNAFWEWFPSAVKHLTVFRITGGEPLMSKDLWKVLDYLKDNPQPNMELAINTNLCVDDKLIDKFISAINSVKGSVKKIDVYTSLESTGAQAEYARYGLVYDTWISNMHKVLSNTTVTVAIMTTINVLSLPTFVDFIDVIMQLRKLYNIGFECNRIPLSINYLRWPPHLNVKILDEVDRVKYSDDIQAFCKSWLKDNSAHRYARLYLEEWDQVQRFCAYLVQNEDFTREKTDFIKFINEIDRRRNTDFITVFPQYTNLLNATKT